MHLSRGNSSVRNPPFLFTKHEDSHSVHALLIYIAMWVMMTALQPRQQRVVIIGNLNGAAGLIARHMSLQEMIDGVVRNEMQLGHA